MLLFCSGIRVWTLPKLYCTFSKWVTMLQYYSGFIHSYPDTSCYRCNSKLVVSIMHENQQIVSNAKTLATKKPIGEL